ncbi:hypothetical protein V6N13_119285 [Hibiscus sabdariffa]|uniref:Uncharacterized protein n=1 Tax=Hibiscus sabdariffa TaxID=183260 RepID=A0ABR2E0W2_9ROSI
MTDVFHSPSPQSTNNTSSSEPALSCAPEISLTCAHDDRNDFVNVVTARDPEEEEEEEEEEEKRDQLSLLALVVTLFRKSLAACKKMDRRELCAMEISWPTNVRHVAHVTFDRFNGFLGLPVEFEPEVPRRAPSASTTVFGVSTESMQLSYDSRGNIVPTILLLMQRRLYAQGGLQAEGIFRINADNSQEEYVREQLNAGVVPEGIDVHCLAGLIKAWFRELPRGVLDSLSPEQVLQCQTEEQCAELARLIPPTEFSLLDWAVNLMADVVQQEHLNKMNARNVAMIFAPNMTQMADPLNALMYAVQVMNFLKTLILRTLREREDSVVEPTSAVHLEPLDDNGDQSPSISCIQDTEKVDEEKELSSIAEEPLSESFRNYNPNNEMKDEEDHSATPTVKGLNTGANQSDETPTGTETFISESDVIVANCMKPGTLVDTGKNNIGQSSNSSLKKELNKISGQQSLLQTMNPDDNTKGSGTRHQLRPKIL